MKSQAEHQPSHDYARDIYNAVKEFNRGNFAALEVGGAWGLSTLAILEAGAKHLTTVDPNLNCKCSEEAIVNGYKDKHSWTVCRSDQFWAENKDGDYDLVYIDGSHIYKDVKNDLAEGWKRLKKGGVMLIDDWDHKFNIKVVDVMDTPEYGVSYACCEFLSKNKVDDIQVRGRVLVFKK